MSCRCQPTDDANDDDDDDDVDGTGQQAVAPGGGFIGDVIMKEDACQVQAAVSTKFEESLKGRLEDEEGRVYPIDVKHEEAEFLRLRFDRSTKEWKKTRAKRRSFKAVATSASVRRAFQESRCDR
uniref:Uncharacterized protein n=1 Tax=Vespula pensylvanica TaxID=30213 RepID=A0A834JUC9_VESPE|nr:hypothetical protein H0235_016895 [Vespula pensylvanica]